MRYSFHGKVRATGQQVDGYVEANSSAEAIDRLADQGIIGVHTVRPEAKKPRNSVVLGGEDSYEDEAPPKALPAPALVAAAPVAPPQPIYIPVPTPMPGTAAGGATDQVLGQLVEKLASLLVQVEKLLARPQQIVYQSGGPARSSGGGGKKSARNDAQDSTLKAIFQTNMDLRKSLDKLSTVTTNGASNGGTGNVSAPVVSAPVVSAPVVSAPVVSAPVALVPAAAPGAPQSAAPRIESAPKTSNNGRERVLKAQSVA